MKKILTLTLMLVFVLANSFEAQAEEKFGHVNLQKALNTSLAGNAAKDRLTEEGNKKREELTTMQDELLELRKEFETKGSLWNEATKKEKEAVFMGKMQAYEEKFKLYGEEYDKQTQIVERGIIEDLTKITRTIAEENGYTYIFESAVGLVYAPKEGDVTDLVIKEYDKMYEKNKKKKK